MKFNFAKKIFCTPNYLSMPAIGISISNHAIRYIDFCNKKDKISLKKYGEVLFPSGIVKDGEILNKEALIKIISELKNELSSNIINVSIPEDKSYIFNIKVPKVSEKEIRQILEFKIEENVPLKVDESIFEYEIVEDFFDKKELLLNVSVVPKSTIIEYSEVFNLAGFYPISFETESKMVAYSTIERNNKGTFMVINIKDDSTVFSIVSDEVVCLTSTVSFGNHSIIESLSKISEFRDKKNDKILDDLLYLNQINNNIFDSLLNIFSVFKDEVEKFSGYWSSQNDKSEDIFSQKIEKVIMCGKCSVLPGFREYIEQSLGIEVTLANVWQNVFNLDSYLPELKFIDSLDYAVPVGLALISHKK